MQFTFSYTRRGIARSIALEAANVADATSLGYIRAGSVIDNVRCEPAVRWTFDNTSMIVVVGHNPENADVTNPTGAIHGVLNFVRAYNDHGDTRELAVTSGSLDPMLAAMTLADRLNRRMSAGKLPVGFDLWPAGRPIYGSHAYVEYGAADDLAIEERERDDERWARIGG